MTTQANAGNPTLGPDGKPVADGTKLIAGKYKTIEEAEAGIKAGEQKMHEALGEAAYWKRQTQELLQGGDRASDGGNDPQHQQQANDQTFTRDFLADPKAGLDAYGRKLTERVVTEVSDYLDRRDAVSQYLNANPDIKENPGLFATHLQNVDPAERGIGRRLKAAHETFKVEVRSIKERAVAEEKARVEFESGQKNRAGTSPGVGAAGGDKPVITEKEEKDSFASYMGERAKERERVLIPQM